MRYSSALKLYTINNSPDRQVAPFSRCLLLSKPLLERSGQGRGPAGVTRSLSRFGHRCGPDHSEGVASRRLGRPSTHEGKDLASARSVWVVPQCPDSAVAVDQARGPVTRRDTGARAGPVGGGGATPPARHAQALIK